MLQKLIIEIGYILKLNLNILILFQSDSYMICIVRLNIFQVET